MNKNKLSNLNPKSVFKYFEKICSIPHGSGNTKEISDYLVSFAKEHNLKYKQDELNNVIIFKDGSTGYENHEPIIIQGHMDMVCEKDDTCPIDMKTEGLDITHNDKYVYANGTTLGGDDGIAVAYSLALLDDNSIPHPPLEIVITVDEETGMDGANGIDLSSLKGNKLINIDSEDEGVFTVSCAGGSKPTIILPVKTQKNDEKTITIIIDGLEGGHSGIEIQKNRANANKVMGELLKEIQDKVSFNLADFAGGTKDNAIPRSCIATITLKDNNVNTNKNISKIAKSFENRIKEKYDEPNVLISVKNNSSSNVLALDDENTNNVIDLINKIPNGVISWSTEIDGLVQTSLNLGIAKFNENELSLTFAVRSSINDEKEQLLSKLEDISNSFNATFIRKGEYPAWEYKKDSKLREVFIESYKKIYNDSPKIEAIHAGLECGLFSAKIKNLDCISIGPQMYDIHTSREKLDIASTERTWNLLLEVLKRL